MAAPEQPTRGKGPPRSIVVCSFSSTPSAGAACGSSTSCGVAANASSCSLSTPLTPSVLRRGRLDPRGQPVLASFRAGGPTGRLQSSTRTSIAKQRRDHIRREPPRRRPAGATSLRSLACSPRYRLQTGATVRWRRAVRAPGRDADDSEAVQAPSKMRTTPRPSPEAPAQADIVACQNSSAAGCSTRAAAAAGSELYQRAWLS